MKWIGDRISFVDDKDSLSFIIYPPKIGKKRILILIWFILWMFVGGYVSTQFFKEYTRDEKLVLVVFMAFWLYFAIRVFSSLIYLYYGREYIKLDSTSIRIKEASGEYGKARQYLLENITKLKVDTPKENSLKKVYEDSPWVKGQHRIVFDYFSKKVAFGRKLSDKDAEMVFRILTKRIDKFVRRK